MASAEAVQYYQQALKQGQREYKNCVHRGLNPNIQALGGSKLQLAQTNRVIAPEIDTMFLATSLKYSYLSSSIVKEIASLGGDISEFLHPQIAERVLEKYRK